MEIIDQIVRILCKSPSHNYQKLKWFQFSFYELCGECFKFTEEGWDYVTTCLFDINFMDIMIVNNVYFSCEYDSILFKSGEQYAQ